MSQLSALSNWRLMPNHTRIVLVVLSAALALILLTRWLVYVFSGEYIQ